MEFSTTPKSYSPLSNILNIGKQVAEYAWLILANNYNALLYMWFVGEEFVSCFYADDAITFKQAYSWQL